MTTNEQIEVNIRNAALHAQAERLVSREVHCNLSSIVSTLAGSYGFCDTTRDLSGLQEQAAELYSPVLDWESAAREAGFRLYEDGLWHAVDQAEDPDESMVINYADAEEVCRENDLEPHEREIYEHWAVSEWLAEKLQEAGERVDMDFGNLCVWGRTTSGQGISSDYVIQQIVASTGYASAHE